MSDADKIGKLHDAFKVADAIEAGKACAVCGFPLASDSGCFDCAGQKGGRTFIVRSARGKDAAADELHQQREAGRAAAAGAAMLLEASQEMINGAHIWRGALVRYPSSDAPDTIGRVESVAAPDGRGDEYAGQVLVQWPQGSAWQYAARLEVLEPAAAIWVLVRWLHKGNSGDDAALPGDEYTREVERLAKRYEARIVELERERAALIQRVASLEASNSYPLAWDALERQRNDAQGERDSWRARYEAQENLLRDAQREKVTLAKHVDALVKERDVLREDVARLEGEAEARAARIVAPQVEVTNAVHRQLESMAGARRFNAEQLTSTGAALATLETLVSDARAALRGGYDTIQVFAEVAGLAIHIAQRVADGTLAGEVPEVLTLEGAYKQRGENIDLLIDQRDTARLELDRVSGELERERAANKRRVIGRADDADTLRADLQRARQEIGQLNKAMSQHFEDRAVLAARLADAQSDQRMAATQLHDAQAELSEVSRQMAELRKDHSAACADALHQRQTLEGERALAAREKAALRIELAEARHDAACADMAPDIALAKMLSSLQAGRDEKMAAALALVEAEAQRQRVKWGDHVTRAKLHDLLAAEVGLVMAAGFDGQVRVRLCKLAALALRALQMPAPAAAAPLEAPAPAAVEVSNAITVTVPEGVSADEVAARVAELPAIQPDGM